MLAPRTANGFIEQELNDRLLAIGKDFDGDVIVYCGPIVEMIDDEIRTALEKIAGSRAEKIIFLLTTYGGSIGVTHRIANTLRHFYPKCVEFVIPNQAFSAGTILALSGDAVHMDYYSRLGPIDPQLEKPDGKYVPALGYLERYNALINKAGTGGLNSAEMNLLLFGFDQAELYKYEEERKLSITLVKDWLVSFKFKDWGETETNKTPVTPEMKQKRAEEIAAALNETGRWHTHGYGISRTVLEKDLGLKIDDFGNNPQRSDYVRSYSELNSDYMARRTSIAVVHTPNYYRVIA